MKTHQKETSLSDAEHIFRQDLITLIPHLRAFARSLCGNATLADDIVQDTMVKALAARKSYRPGTNMKAWAFTILRNQFYSLARRSNKRFSLDPEVAENTILSVDSPLGTIRLNEMRQALNELPHDQREALILVGAGGFSYIEAGDICGVATGTIKSRVSRARAALVDIIDSGKFDNHADDMSALNAMSAINHELTNIVNAADNDQRRTEPSQRHARR